MTATGASLAGHATRLAAQADRVAALSGLRWHPQPIVDDPQAARPLQGIVELHRPWPTNSPPPPSSRAARPPT
jgi:hypothetical protein